ncbi:DUF4124 domain-containing protein [Massilia sp. METH4]|uniref:DUF4124 domain-containing protein n=1 Tax=Massilia sp. METH4 TaxID=3123041 RepID=UPI0030D4817E
MRVLLAIASLAAALPAHAQMYKCVDGGKVTYSEAPCARGTQTVMKAQDAPAMQPEPGELERMQVEAARLQQERKLREAREDRLDAARERQAARRREQCARLQRASKWAADDARRATAQGADAARLKAARAAERHAAECQ